MKFLNQLLILGQIWPGSAATLNRTIEQWNPQVVSCKVSSSAVSAKRSVRTAAVTSGRVTQRASFAADTRLAEGICEASASPVDVLLQR
jgi:hypothetical protein